MNQVTSPQAIYDSADRGAWLLREARELFAYRTLLRLLVINQFKQRYRRSLLGMGWMLVGPLLNTAVLSVAFNALFRNSIAQYPVYVMVGLIAWNFFAQTTTLGVDAAISGSGLLQRVYLPRSMFVIATLGGAVINMGIALIALLIVLLTNSAPLYATWLLLPLAIAVLALFTLGVTLLVATLAVFVGDVAHMYQLLVQALFFLTPIVYPAEIVPSELRWLVQLNPMSVLVDLFRTLLYRGQVPDLSQWLSAAGLALTALCIGWALFAWKADECVYYL
ncbi:MAG: ABC transporter permease [Kouleothrix sp.]|nr:ABC transporter permease [Kouleothrix sp.]